MAQYSWDEWTKKYITSTWDVLGWWKAYKTSEWKWSLEDPSKSNTQTVTYNGKVDNSTNVISQQSQNNNATNAKVWTWAVAWMPEQPKTETVKTSPITVDSLAKSWGALTYAEQQNRLSANPWLKEKLASKGIVSKTEPEKTTPTTPTTTPTAKTTTTPKQTAQQDKWDYQDNSQARMNEIADNLDKYRQTMPALFDDMSAFYNFFIKDKWRSQDQIDFLWDYFNRVQKYWKYDNYSSAQLWDWLANGKIPADYLNYLKSTDPNKYAEVMAYKQEEEDTITYESFLSDIADQAGLWRFEKFYKWIFGYRDENDDKIDDSLYIAPTEEETTKQNRINTIDSRIMEIKNMEKNMLDDLVEQYPWVPKATLMWIVQDRTKDLQREYDDLMVERAGLFGSVEYLQNERDMQSKARQSTINNLEKAYWMYYDYTAEWIAEMAQNKYAATNITLDQADSGNETQQQMALEAAITPIFEQYWDIIQRSPAEVINDTIAYAKKNWVWLRQALEESFTKYLKEKPAYKAMQAALSEPNLQTIWYNSDGKAIYWYWDSVTKTFKPVTVWADGITSTTAWDGTSYTTNTQPLNNFIANLETKYTIAPNWWTWGSKIRSWWCWTVVNDYLWSIWDNLKLKEANDIKAYATSKTPVEWAVAYFDWTQSRATPETKKHGHVWIVVSDNGDTITVLESNEWTWLRYKDYKKSWVSGYYIPDWIKSTEYNTQEYNKAFTDAANVIKQYIDWLWNKETFISDVEDYLANWDYTTLINEMMAVWKGNADSTVRDKINASETAIVDLISIKDALEAYYAAWGDTWILQWNLEEVANALWNTTDPRLVWLATKISEAIQAYRKNISWTAFNDREAGEYEDLFPSIKAWEEYNTAKVQEVLDSMIIRASWQYSNLFWPWIYMKLLDAHERATWRKYSVYEEQSDLYRYLADNWYLTPSWAVKTADDFASRYQSQQSQRKGKRF